MLTSEIETPPMLTTTILIIDDDTGLRETLRSLLELEGYTVAMASDGLDALRQLDRVMPKAILLDVRMPRMDGYEFLEELRRLGRRDEFPIIVLTADTLAQARMARVGVEGFLAKPFDIDDLLNKIEEVRLH
ncbi:MAG: hypothetical protein OJF49_003315 [Ktedonobacterales bacterium]|jgi:chemosensory pili system protein ChpA (sensor histidine kinase/response regulator)|nr:MAG: hypothetical protein OJF49_003315 [Ktedonobacterales bacterium]